MPVVSNALDSRDRHRPEEERGIRPAGSDCRGRLIPSGLVGELMFGEAFQRHLEPARVEIVLRGPFENRKGVQEPEPVPREQANHAGGRILRERD